MYIAALPSWITVVVEDYTTHLVKKQHYNSILESLSLPRVMNETFQTDSKFLDSCCLFCDGSWREKKSKRTYSSYSSAIKRRKFYSVLLVHQKKWSPSAIHEECPLIHKPSFHQLLFSHLVYLNSTKELIADSSLGMGVCQNGLADMQAGRDMDLNFRPQIDRVHNSPWKY